MKKLLLATFSLAAFSGSALAADLPARKEPIVAPASLPMWTGFYAGLNAGYAFGVTDTAENYGWANPISFKDFDTYVSTNSATSFAIANSYPGRGIAQNGFIGGGQVGYNFQWQERIILGLEADIQGAGIRGTGNANGYGPFTNSPHSGNGFVNNNIVQGGIDWLGTARARIGYLITPAFQIYGTGGLAYGGAYLNTRANSSFGGEGWGPGPFGTAGAVSSGFWLYGTDTSYASKSQLLVGYTAGAGGEWMLMPNWSIKAEALYYNLGNQQVSNYLYSYGSCCGSNLPNFAAGSTTQLRYDGIIGRAGINYHFYSDNSADASQIKTARNSFLKISSSQDDDPIWSGAYAGLNAGYAVGITQGATNYGWANPDAIVNYQPNETARTFALASSFPGRNLNQGGFIGGGQIGYNYQWDKYFVIGLETDMQGAGIRGTGNANGIAIYPDASGGIVNNNIVQGGIDWLGTTRARVGYLVAPNFQIYGTGGLAYGGAFLNTFSNASIFDNQMALSAAWDYYGLTTSYAAKNQLLTGYTAGGGGEWLLSNKWSVKLEAIYYNLGTQSVQNAYYTTENNDPLYSGSRTAALSGSTTRTRYDGVIARAGINYHFDFGKNTPVAAKF